ncbi:DUF4262 domain-containing protein [Spirillospora sp. NPDC049652]
MSDGRRECHCVLDHDYGDRDRMDTFNLRTIVHIAQYGFSVVLVQPEERTPGWVYSIGLWHSFGAAELAMFGGDVYEMEETLNTLGRRTADGTAPNDGDVDPEVARGHPASFRTVEPTWYRAAFPGAVSFYRRPPLPFLQVVWPDGGDLFPWQPGTTLDFRRTQPWLWLPPREHPEGVWAERLRPSS